MVAAIIPGTLALVGCLFLLGRRVFTRLQEVNAAVQADHNARERANTQRQQLDSLLLLILTPAAK